MRFICLLGLSIILLTGTSRAQFIWNDGAHNSSYSDPGNWTGGVVPPSGSNIVIGTMNSGDVVGLDTGSDVNVSSWTFSSTLNTLGNPVAVFNDGLEQLNITGATGIANSSNLQNEFDVVVNAATNTNLSGGSAGINFQSGLNLSHFNVTTSGTVTIAANQNLIFDLNSTSTYGRIGSVVATSAVLVVHNNGYTANAHAGDTFDLTTGNFNGAVLGSLPTLSGGLMWDTSQLFSSGIISVYAVPEPSSYALLLGGLVLIIAFKRRPSFARIISRKR